jgi:hypothetical protein
MLYYLLIDIQGIALRSRRIEAQTIVLGSPTWSCGARKIMSLVILNRRTVY